MSKIFDVCILLRPFFEILKIVRGQKFSLNFYSRAKNFFEHLTNFKNFYFAFDQL